MTDDVRVLRLTAFSSDPEGGNPAGVVLDASGLSNERMQGIAAEVGYAETAFVTEPPRAEDPGRMRIRYFSPTAEVPFCGHATVATAVALADGLGSATVPTDGAFLFATPVGDVRITTRREHEGTVASFTSVEPIVTDIPWDVRGRLLSLLGVAEGDLEPSHPPRLSFAGNTHPVLVLADPGVFDGFAFDPADARALMDEQGWAGTITVAHAVVAAVGPDAGPIEYETRNIFPVGTMNEDPATGSAAAAFGAYLRALGLVRPPQRVLIHQGRHVGRPGLLTVDVPATGGIVVSGTATLIPDPPL
jgi:PhzF family phenazine biosynthesis protein